MSQELRAWRNERPGDRSEGFEKRWHSRVLEMQMFVERERAALEGGNGAAAFVGRSSETVSRSLASIKADNAGGVERHGLE